MKQTVQQNATRSHVVPAKSSPSRPAPSEESTGNSLDGGPLLASPQVRGLAQLQQDVRRSPRLSRLRDLSSAVGTWRRAAPPDVTATAQRLETPGERNRTGLPDGLKSGVESLSGMSLDNVRVHYNSAQPAQLNALAYAQGTDIHVAPGQEEHLPHEAWHVVQQAQGGVRPTIQMKGGVPINDDAGLEREADRMGAKALLTKAAPRTLHPIKEPPREVSQRMTARVRREENRAPTAQEIATARQQGIANSQRVAGHGRRAHGRRTETPSGVQEAQAARDREEAAQQAVQLKQHVRSDPAPVGAVRRNEGVSANPNDLPLSPRTMVVPPPAQLSIRPAQRRIHEWKDTGWQPGPQAREGTKDFPGEPSDGAIFFNDVTGQQGKTPKEAAESLSELAVKMGSVAEKQIAVSSFGTATNALENEFPADEPNRTYFLGYFSFNRADETWKWDAGGDNVKRGAWTEPVSSFLKNLMVANGQMDYIRTRDWYVNGTHGVEVDINYYVNRAFGTAPAYWHKDTGGGNLFVNLIFTNAQPIIGTELTADTRKMTDKKAKSLVANLGNEQTGEIEKTRSELLKSKWATGIHSPLLPNQAYVSWVDELFWHSSPFMGNRAKWTSKMATQVMLGDWVDPEPFFKTETPTTYEAMVVIAATPDTFLRKLVPDGDLSKLDIDLARELHSDTNTYNEEMIEVDIRKVQWGEHKLNDAFGHEQDGEDPRVVRPAITLIAPSGIEGRPRALSNAEERDKLPKVGNAQGRNFIRTWVRVKPLKI